MKWKNEVPNKAEFLKANSFNFIENEKVNSALVHEHNFQRMENAPGCHKGAQSAHSSPTSNKENIESRTMSETLTLTTSKTDFTGTAPKRYISKCFIKPVTAPVWYSESLFLHIGSTKRKFEEKVYFKNKLIPFRWSENMSTEVKTGPKCVLSELNIPIDDDNDYHYISFEQQQLAAKDKSTEL